MFTWIKETGSALMLLSLFFFAPMAIAYFVVWLISFTLSIHVS